MLPTGGSGVPSNKESSKEMQLLVFSIVFDAEICVAPVSCVPGVSL